MGDLLGKRIGNYHLRSLLGHGGFADVYLGEHIHLSTLAAIKILHTQLTEKDTNSFRNEARIIANLKHPNIVSILDFGVEETTPFLVMEYAAGGNMRQRYPKDTIIAPKMVLSLVKQLASALQYAHNQKIIHRDIKPENIVLRPNGEVLLSDFGIALVTESILAASQLPNAEEAAGTVVYMAPEVYQGRPGPASDQYALAVMVYEWLCGARPFNGTYTEIALKHLSVLPPPLRQHNASILQDVENAVLIALAKDPAQRFKSVQAFAIALEQAFGENIAPVIPHVKSPQPPAEKEQKPVEASIHALGRRLVLGAEPITLGSALDNHLVIPDRQVSAYHARIFPTGQGYSVIDLGSLNGTFIGGVQLAANTPHLLNHTENIRVGETTITYIMNATRTSSGADASLPPDRSNAARGDYLATAPAERGYQTPSNPPYTGYGQPYQAPQPNTPQSGQQPWVMTPGGNMPPQSYPQWPAANNPQPNPATPYPPGPAFQAQPQPPVVLPQAYPPGPTTGGMPIVSPQPYQPAQGTGGMGVLPQQYPAPQGMVPVLPPPPKTQLSARALGLLIIALILVIGGSITGIIALKNKQNTDDQNATASAVALNQAHAAATAAAGTATAISLMATTVAINQTYPFSNKLVFNDPLVDNSKNLGWDTGSSCVFTGGAYHVMINHQNIFVPCLSAKTNYSNLTFQANMTIVQGDSSHLAAGGLVFAADSSGSNGYIFIVGLDGTYILSLLNGGHLKLVKNGTASSFHAGLNQPNTVGVVFSNSQLALYVNNQFVTCASDTTYTSGGIGFFGVQGNTTTATDVAYSNAMLWQLTTPQLPC